MPEKRVPNWFWRAQMLSPIPIRHRELAGMLRPSPRKAKHVHAFHRTRLLKIKVLHKVAHARKWSAVNVTQKTKPSTTCSTATTVAPYVGLRSIPLHPVSLTSTMKRSLQEYVQLTSFCSDSNSTLYENVQHVQQDIFLGSAETLGQPAPASTRLT